MDCRRSYRGVPRRGLLQLTRDEYQHTSRGEQHITTKLSVFDQWGWRRRWWRPLPPELPTLFSPLLLLLFFCCFYCWKQHFQLETSDSDLGNSHFSVRLERIRSCHRLKMQFWMPRDNLRLHNGHVLKTEREDQQYSVTPNAAVITALIWCLLGSNWTQDWREIILCQALDG